MALDSYHFIEKPASGPDAPLVFVFHGTGGDERQLLGLADQLLPGAAVIAPRGDVSEHGAARFFRRKAEGIYDMDDLTDRTARMAAFIAAHRERIAPGQVVGLGYSNGANILASVAFRDPALFDAIVLMHPLIPWTPAANPDLATLRVLITAGRSDPICPAPLTDALSAYFSRQGSRVSEVWHDGGHEIRQSELAAAAGFLAPGPA
ncbi:alpha/beta hydrolase [Polymorphum gilvum]|uniref:Phospholipase/carboxylesterase family protein n=1 Tax=Polymorphum gilvum (strain LMG 25793 / CGMCC 1.9160 / SL003B-26A1) TaxID=991905 RepID=F2IV29_POLGS|nr:alpha/beta hydrolase [Polymorphum gilvum]ADZ71360.1 Phospholipase/carboxylesterase family protein [Polymorphum gilvum SL003B-26A1]